jgi:hypothetical protein
LGEIVLICPRSVSHRQSGRPAWLFGLLATFVFAVASLTQAARADTITEFRGGVGVASTGNWWGQSVTTSGSGTWSNLVFNFYNQANGNPYAVGNLYLLSSA